MKKKKKKTKCHNIKSNIKTNHVTKQTNHVTQQTSHVTKQTNHMIKQTNHVTQTKRYK